MRKKAPLIPLLFLALVSLQVFNRCANIIQPTGGPRDSIPPTLVESIPENQTINYTETSFYFEFDEKIKTDKLRDQLIITPRTDTEYDIKYAKRGIELMFDDAFQENTTYTFNFREGIADVTEGNPTEDNKFVFSTGPNIDSLSIEGHVTVLLTQDTLNEITVGLYDVEDTITIFNGSPYYFTQTDEEGYFIMENLKNGRYTMYAFNDGNKNLELESRSEDHGFIEDTLLMNRDTAGVQLHLIALDLRPLKMMSALPSGHYFDVNYNKYITQYDYQVLETQTTLNTSFAKDHQSVRFYNTFDQPDSLPVRIGAYDSLNIPVADTVYIKFQKTSRRKEPLTMQVAPGNNDPVNEKFELEIQLNKPVAQVLIDSIYIQFDTTKLFTIPHDSVIQWNFNRNHLTIPVHINKAEADTILHRREKRQQMIADSLKNLEASKTEEKVQQKKQIGKNADDSDVPKLNRGLQLYIAKGAFTTFDQDSTSAMKISYKSIEPEEYGTISGTVDTSYENYFVQLLSEQDKVVQQYNDDKNYVFKNVAPGKYRIRVLIDANADGQWSPGNMRRNIEPEPVYFFEEKISIRANWELHQDLTF